MLTHRNLVSDVVQCVAWNVDAVRGKERMLAAIPFFHVYGMTVAMNEALYLAAAIILLPRFNVDEALEAINTHRPTRFPAFPPCISPSTIMPGSGNTTSPRSKYAAAVRLPCRWKR